MEFTSKNRASYILQALHIVKYKGATGANIKIYCMILPFLARWNVKRNFGCADIE